MKNASICIIILSLLTGCATQSAYTSTIALKTDYSDAHFDNDLLSAKITYSDCTKQSVQNVGCKAFIFQLTNKSKEDILIDWNKTVYIEDGQSSGGFMFEGIIYKDRNAAKSNDVVFPGSTITKVIWPNNLVSYSPGRYSGWQHRHMPMAKNGVYLLISDDKNKEQRIKLMADVRAYFE